MNAISGLTADGAAMVPGEAALKLIAQARMEWGATNQVSTGALVLAEELAEKADDDANRFVTNFGGWAEVLRWLADQKMPGDDIGQELGALTEGRVMAKFWLRHAPSGFQVAMAALIEKLRGPVEPVSMMITADFSPVTRALPQLRSDLARLRVALDEAQQKLDAVA